METKDIIKQIENLLTGDPIKDGPFLKEQAEKFKDEENSDEINRELAKLAYNITKEEYESQLNNFLESENQKVNEQLENVKKRYENKNYNGGIKILEEIINNNFAAWHDTPEYTYKSFGSPLEFLLYTNLYEPEKEVKSVNCNLAGVYWMYCHGLMQKRRYNEALAAIERSVKLNPVDPDAYLQFSELMKFCKNFEELKICCDKLLKCAVTKEQIGKAYFNYSYYFSEKHDIDSALAMLEMSRLFMDSEIIDSEIKYISNIVGMGSVPRKHTSAELMEIMNSKNIQAGPSTAVIQTAYFLAKRSEGALEFKDAKFYYEIVWELTEDDSISDILQELSRTISDINSFK